MSQVDFEKLARAVAELDQNLVEKLTRGLLSKKVDPTRIIENGLVSGINEVGRKYEKGEFFLAELMFGANAFNAAYQILEPLLKEKTGERRKGVVVLGTVAGDIHSIGKDILKTMFIAEGFTVHDLGVDVPIDKFIETAEEFNADFICASALLTTTIPMQQELIEKLKEKGLRNKVRVLVGGAATTEQWALKIGADGWGQTAVDGVKKAVELISGAGKR
jgi:corrinoid protein of di/trimethylamine methyltransferase